MKTRLALVTIAIGLCVLSVRVWRDAHETPARLSTLRQIIESQFVPRTIEFDSQTVNDGYWALLAAIYRGDTEKALIALESDTLARRYKMQLAGVLGKRLFELDNYRQAAIAWQYLASDALSGLDEYFERQARHYEATRNDFMQAERHWQMWLALARTDWIRYRRVAEFYERRNDRAAARNIYTLGEQATTAPYSNYLAGRRLELVEAWSEAFVQYQEAFKHSADFADAYIRAAQVASYHLQKTDLAISFCQQGVQLKPEDYFCYELLARLLWQSEQPDVALAWLDKGLAHVERASYLALFHNLKGDISLSQQNLQMAETEYGTALTIQPERIDALVGLARVHKAHGETQMALGALLQAIELSKRKDSPAAEWYTLLGELYEETGTDDLAIAAYQTALGLNPADQATQKRLTSLLNGAK